VTLGEELGLPAGRDVAGQLNAVLRRLGFQRVFDTAFTADLTIMEEASELVHRLKNGGRLPMMTSCSPGWIKYVETFSPEHLENLSTCRSPQQMLGSLIKRYFAPKEGMDPAKVMSVSIMPCTAKKFEAGRAELGNHGMADVDAVLTTRELARLIRMHGIVMDELSAEPADDPFGNRTTAGRLFGATGGVMEAAVRTAHWMVTGRELEQLEVTPVRGMNGVKEARVNIDGLELGLAVVSGLGNAGRLLEQLRQGRDDLHFIEVMTCPGGCINGGGQPHGSGAGSVQARMNALYDIDQQGSVRVAHQNPAVQRLYEELLGSPLSHVSHELLHTHYAAREALV
ncbi:MAG: [Fe-Fe] hydrogenase large subunit C-terminal domain-containing protein, partial [Patescibacteria group bacterium]|nr:[Fe-Fe] hydrogenase large subunit C-terminal domain-containing protein [Patescibacteria group bacterium]